MGRFHSEPNKIKACLSMLFPNLAAQQMHHNQDSVVEIDALMPLSSQKVEELGWFGRWNNKETKPNISNIL